MRPRILLPLAAAAALACAATASADSLVYTKDGNVWLSSPDASRSYQVTFDGGYSSPKRAGTTLSYTLATPSRVTITVKRGRKAVKGSIRTAGKPGHNRQRFMGRV